MQHCLLCLLWLFKCDHNCSLALRQMVRDPYQYYYTFLALHSREESKSSTGNSPWSCVFSWAAPRAVWKGASLSGPKECWGLLCTPAVPRSELPFQGHSLALAHSVKQIQPFTLTAPVTTIKKQWSVLIYLRKEKEKYGRKTASKSYGAGGALNCCTASTEATFKGFIVTVRGEQILPVLLWYKWSHAFLSVWFDMTIL